MGGAEALGAGGLIIYKDFAFDADSQADIAVYTSYQHFGSVDNVVTASGQTLRILPGQTPFYIPQAGDPNRTPVEVERTIRLAESRFPQYSAKLEAYRHAWAAAPPPPVAQTNRPAAAAPQREVSADLAPASAGRNVLRMRSGETFQAWKLSRVEGDYVVITHADGVSRVAIADLPDNLYGFPDEVIARAQLFRERRNEEARKEYLKASAFSEGTPFPLGTH